MNERMKEWTNERMNEWTNERMNEWTNERMNEWTNERMNEWTNERMNEWTNERMNEWTNEWMNEWKNEWTNEWTNERTNEWMNEWCVGVFSFLIGTGYLASFLPSCPSVCNELCKLPFLVLSSHHYHLSYKKYGLRLSHRFTVAFFKTPFSTNQKWIAEENCWMDLSSSSPSEPPLSETRWSHLHHPHPMSLQRNHPG